MKKSNPNNSGHCDETEQEGREDDPPELLWSVVTLNSNKLLNSRHRTVVLFLVAPLCFLEQSRLDLVTLATVCLVL